MRRTFVMLLALLMLLPAAAARAEDGYDLWLRYRPLESTAASRLAATAGTVEVADDDPVVANAAAELTRAIAGLTGGAPGGDAGILLGTAAAPRVAALRLPLGDLGEEGFVVRRVAVDGRPMMVVAANRPAGVLYGAFRLIRAMQLGEPLDRLDVTDRPRLDRRLLNHWDNLDRSVERGYAGQSLWDWQKLPGFADPRYTDYARANASIGINGTVLNNVNSNADILTPPFLEKVARLAEVFRPWGIRVYLSARFSAPREIGGLPTADPLDPAVRAWWRAKADEIYARIPDFGGFLVKANSEGQPGPQDYGRSHADGANMLADAVAPHRGIVMWRAFVYAAEQDEDRLNQAYSEFQPLDGRFADNVIVQVKNGPLDFQPREPFHPLFGAMPRTPLFPELQITKEYLGFATHLAYLGPMWEEFLQADTHRPRRGTSVADGVMRGRLTGIAGVANIGTDRNWSGSQFDQANWYAFGRLAWNPNDRAEPIADDWARLTWSDAAAPAIVPMMMASRQAVVDYMTPLGLTHLMATGHHYGPGPWVDDLERDDWNPVYFHRADRDGIGVDRTARGTGAAAQYAPALARRFGDPKTAGDDLLLWFHRRAWDDRTASGRTVWDELAHRYDRGLAAVGDIRGRWQRLSPIIDAGRFAEVDAFLAIQQDEARWWRDASLAYWSDVSGRPLGEGIAPPRLGLDAYRAIRHPYAPGN